MTRLQYVDGLFITQNTTTCDLSSNLIECPVPNSVFDRCTVTCQVTNATSSTLQMRIQGDVTTFRSENFLAALARMSNSSVSRFKIDRVTSGSVIVDMTVTPPAANAVNEGSADRIVQILSAKTPADYNAQNITLLSIVSPVPQNKPSELSTGAVVAIVVSITAFIIIIVIMTSLFFVKRYRYRQSLLRQDIDLSQINLGAAKKNVINMDELRDLQQVGAGAYGVVFRAKWRDIMVACKQVSGRPDVHVR